MGSVFFTKLGFSLRAQLTFLGLRFDIVSPLFRDDLLTLFLYFVFVDRGGKEIDEKWSVT